MKSTYLEIMILATFIAVITTGIYLFWPKDTKITETNQTIAAPQAQDNPIQSTETIQEPANSSEPINEMAVQSESVPEQTQTLPIATQQRPQARKSIEKPKC